MGLLGDFARQYVGNPAGDPMGSLMQFVMNRQRQGGGQEQPQGQPMGGNMMQSARGIRDYVQRNPSQNDIYRQQAQGVQWLGPNYQQWRPSLNKGQLSPYAGLGNMGMWRR